MPTSSSPQAKPGRAKDGKTNGSNARPTAPDLKSASSAITLGRPSDEEIARRAYEIYEREGRQPGRELENWLKAEAELSGKSGH